MAGQVVHLKKPTSAEQIADEETKIKAAMLAWADDGPPAAAQRLCG
jgi:hypothetical protein